MSKAEIVAITMPKWGLSMTEGKVMEWLVEEGAVLKVGDAMVDIETEKIANTFEALDAGTLSKIVATPDEILPIGALLGVLTTSEISDEEITAFVEEFQANYVPPEPESEEGNDAYAFIEVDNYKIRYSKMGDGEKNIILIHGFGGDSDRWLFTQQPLSELATVYALDLPGHGQSTKIISDPSVRGLAKVVLSFMDELGLDQAHLIGHSLGGAIALQTAELDKSRVTRISLIAPVGLGSEINEAYINEFITADSRKQMKKALQELVADPNLVNRSLVNDMLKFKRTDGVEDALKAIASQFITEEGTQADNFLQVLSDLPKSMVIWGSEDKIIPSDHCNGLGEGVSVHILEGYGHLVQLEAANEVNSLLLDLI